MLRQELCAYLLTTYRSAYPFIDLPALATVIDNTHKAMTHTTQGEDQ